MWQIISAYVCAVIMMVGVFFFARIVLNKKNSASKKKLFCIIQVVYVMHILAYLNLDGTPKTLMMFFTNMLFYKYVFNISIKKSIFLIFLYMLILIIPDMSLLFFMTQILGFSREFCYNTYAGSIISNVIICILVLILTYILKNLLRKLISEKIENNIKIIFFSISIFVCVGMFFYTMIREFRVSNDIILYLIAIAVLILVLFSLMKQTIENKKITERYDKLLEFMVTYENEVEKQRTLRHESKNELRAIRAKICDKQDNKEIVEYIDEILKDKIKVNHEEYAKFGYLPANGIKGLCYFKVQEAEEKGIQVALNISKRIKQSTIYDLDTKEQRDFGRILGVFLDNAIEASLNSNKKQLGIEAYINEEKEFRMIISNTYDNQINKEKIGKESFSTKGKGRGHGLLLVKNLTENSEIFETRTEIQEKIYVQTIIIKKK